MNLNYNHLTTDKADLQAMLDVKTALSPISYQTLMDTLKDTGIVLRGVNTIFAYAGVTGFAFHAFCRQYRLKEYRAWLAENNVSTDERGWSKEDIHRGLNFLQRAELLKQELGRKPTFEELHQLALNYQMLPEEHSLWAHITAENYYYEFD